MLVENGTITPHLNPQTLESCSAKAKAEPKAKDEEPKPATKAPAKKA